jgi:glycosyltransferase involved in cell wall biosynthesis
MKSHDDRPCVSIVIPTYNRAEELKAALQSVIDQTVTDWQAWVINNYSQDDTVSVIEQFNDPRIHRLDIHNNGIIAMSRNEGIRRSTGNLIAFLDSDDLWMPTKLERVIQVFEKDQSAGAVCHWEYVRKGGVITKTLRYGPQKKTSYRRLLFGGNQLSPSAATIRKELLDKVCGFDENPAWITVEDYDLWLKLAKTGCRMVFLPEVLGEFRITGKNFSSKVELHYNAVRRLVMRHYNLLEERQIFDPILLSRRIAKTYYGAAWEYYRTGNKKLALYNIGRSLVKWPISLKSCLSLLIFLMKRCPEGC